MTNGLKNKISDVLKINPHDYSENTLRIMIEDRLIQTKENVFSAIGKSIKSQDIVITKEENNILYQITDLHNSFMQEFEESLNKN